MAGGKETPRQKMIGMMYLVLTALLALNVSKSILDAFVNIEENIQVGNITEHMRGNAQIAAVLEKANEKDSTGQIASPRAGVVYNAMEKIDKLTAEKIQFIDKIKLMVFQAIAEDLDPKAEKPICILEKGQVLNFSDTKNPRLTKSDDFVKPIRMNLHNVQKKDAYDEQMLLMGINESIEQPNKAADGFKVWDQMLDFRAKLPGLLVDAVNEISKLDDSTGKGKGIVFKDPKIVAFKDIIDLGIKMDGAVSSVKDPGLAYEIKKIYSGLTKNEKIPDPNGETGPLHWIGMTFDHAPAVAAIAALSGLQSEVLTARADALAYLASLVGGGSYSFNAVEGRAFAPPSAAAGAKIKMDVMMVAYDTEKQPIVVPDQGVVLETRDGKAIVEFTAPSGGEMELTGSVAIKDKNGQMKMAKYSTKLQVVTKAGSISLPEVSVLYTDWPNKVAWSAAGVVSSDISCSGCSSATSATWTTAGTQYKGKKIKVAPGRNSVTLSLSGKDADGNSISFGAFKYNVKGFPKPVVLTPSLSKDRGGFLNVGLPPSSPLQGVNYTVLGGDINGSGFSGKRVTAANLASVKRGKTAGIYLRVKRSDNGKVYNIQGAVKVN
ncbi:hypothetical protein N8Z79_03085 [Crocinitomicaceae bacterium]|nr:hypothetical protein [Crocinitomicaceae bacterium]